MQWDVSNYQGTECISTLLNGLAEAADALAPANALSPEALHVARVYDTLDTLGKELLTWITNHEAACIAASEPDEFKKRQTGNRHGERR